jgi:predicted Zn-dependent protease
VEAPLFPYLALRAQILHKSARVGGDDIIINRYLKDKADPVNNYAACLVYSLKGDADESIGVAGENKSSFKNIFMGEMFIDAQKFPEAVDVLKTGTEPVARFLLAKAYEGQGKNETAISTLKGLLSYGSIFPEIYYRLGMLYGRTGEEARGYDYLGRFYVETGKLALAKTNLEKAVSRYGINSPEAKEVLQILDSIKKDKQ